MAAFLLGLNHWNDLDLCVCFVFFLSFSLHERPNWSAAISKPTIQASSMHLRASHASSEARTAAPYIKGTGTDPLASHPLLHHLHLSACGMQQKKDDERKRNTTKKK